MNFKDGFLYYIKILQCIFELKNNGWISKESYKTGMPNIIHISFVTEILSIRIMSDQEIKGFKTPMMSIDIKMIQHTDDYSVMKNP